MLKIINEKLHTPAWLFVVMLVVLIFRVPSFFEPYSYGDEMIYLTLGEGIRQNVPLYKGIHDNKPPLLYVTAALAGSLFWFKALLAIWHIVTIFVFWKLAEVLFPKNERLHKVATIIFALLTTIPLLEGNIANAENFMLGFTLLGFLLLLKPSLGLKAAKLAPIKIILAGVFFSIASLFKIPAAFDVPAIVFLWLLTTKLNKNSLVVVIKNTTYLLVGFLTPIVVFFAWYLLKGAFSEYLIAAYLQNFGYLSSWRPDDIAEPFLTKNGPLLLRAGIVTAGFFILYIKRKRLSKQFIFATAWLLLGLFAVTLSERPYPHYLLQIVPAASILLAMLITLKTLEQTYVIIPLALAFLTPVYFKFWYYPTTPYYTKFIKFAAGNISKNEYFETFGGSVLRNYEIADFLVKNTRKNEKVFVWGDSSAIYALSRRLPPIKYVADYHIRDFSTEKETVGGLKANMPSFVIILPDSSPSAFMNTFLRENYGQTLSVDGAEVWKLLNPRVRVLIAP